MAVLLPNGKQSFTTNAGAPLVGGKLYTYDAGTNNPRTTYADAAGTAPNANPVVLDARGEATVFWSGTYKVVLKDAAGSTIWTNDYLSTAPDGGTATALQQQLSGPTGAASVGFIQAGAGAVARTAQDKMRERISAEDYSTIANAIASAGPSEVVQVTGTPSYTASTQWNGRKHQTDEAPFLLNSFTWPGANLNARMCVSNGMLYVAEYSNSKLGIFSLADPRAPRYLSSTPVGANPRHVDVFGRYAFVCCTTAGTIEIYDVSPPTSPGLVGSITTGAEPKMFQIVGNEIFVVCNGASTLEKYLFELPPAGASGFSFSTLGSVSVPTGPLCLAHNGDGLIAVCGLGTNIVQIFGASTLNALGATAVGGAGHATCVWATKTQLLVTDSPNNLLWSLDCSSLTPIISSSVATSTAPEQIEIVGNRCYAPSLTTPGTQAYLDCFDITDAASPTKYKSVPLTVTGAGFTAYCSDGLTSYIYVSGHFSPYNLDIVEVVAGPSGRKPTNAFESLYSRQAGVGLLDTGAQTLRYATKISNYAATASDFVIRVGLGATITLPDPAAMQDGKVLIIENVSSTQFSAVSNAFVGYKGSLPPFNSVVLVAQQFGGAYQWDRVSQFKDRAAYSTYTANVSLTVDNEVVRVGSGSGLTVTLPDPSTMLGKVFTIKNVHASAAVTVSNAFSGHSGSLAAGKAVTIVAMDSGGSAQWDAVSQY